MWETAGETYHPLEDLFALFIRAEVGEDAPVHEGQAVEQRPEHEPEEGEEHGGPPADLQPQPPEEAAPPERPHSPCRHGSHLCRTPGPSADGRRHRVQLPSGLGVSWIPRLALWERTGNLSLPQPAPHACCHLSPPLSVSVFRPG